MSCEQCVNRRAFLARAAAAAGATAAIAALSACGDGQLSGVAPQLPGGTVQKFSVKVSDFPQLATVGVLVRIGSIITGKRTGPDTFDAFDMRCTHQRCGVNIVNGQTFQCPCHFSRFANDGSVIQGPATQPLAKLLTSYDSATDTLTIG